MASWHPSKAERWPVPAIVLRFSEHAAYGRIEAARAARRFPMVLDLLQEGSITLTTITLLAPHLTAENHRDVLRGARHKTKREVEQIVAGLRPQPDVVASVRKLPERKLLAERLDTASRFDAPVADTTPTTLRIASATARPAVIAPLAPERYKIQLTVSRGLAIFRPRFGVRSGRAMTDAAHLSGRTGGAVREVFSSSTTSFHMRREVWRMLRTSSCGAERTTRLKRSCSLGRGWCGRQRPCGADSVRTELATLAGTAGAGRACLSGNDTRGRRRMPAAPSR